MEIAPGIIVDTGIKGGKPVIQGTRIPEEVEEVCFGQPLILKSRQSVKGLNPTYYVLGQTDTGRYLFIVFIYLRHGRAMLVTARDMDLTERKYFQRRY